MLTTLSIRNFALIEKLDIDFSDKFSTITGETGAGKSILLGALGLVLGNRADLTSLKDKESKCIIEANFNLEKYNLNQFFDENDLDYEKNTIIRREILPSGKSRAFINDSPVNLEELKSLSSFLIDIHSQHQTQELTNEEYQIQILDAIASNSANLELYKQQLKIYKIAKTELKKCLDTKNSLAKDSDYNSFLWQELADANLIAGEQIDLETSLEKLSNIEFIKENIEKSIDISNEEQFGIIQNLKEVKITLQKITNVSSDFKELNDRISSVLIEFEDINSELNSQSEKLINDPEKLDSINQKLQSIYSLQKKHNVSTVEELLSIQNDLDSKIVLFDDIDGQIQKLEEELEQITNSLHKLANNISEERKKAIPVLISKLSEILDKLGMPNAQFNFEISTSTSFLSNGNDEVQLLFSANKGTQFGLLKKVASGGEMSRIMLAVKSILASYSKLPTIIFDEIDTGVSGEIAHKMGDIMKTMSQYLQVFAITHLPQIAAKGDQHYKVYKFDQGISTVSEIKLLESEERIIEIAQMLSGKDISESALSHAKALLN